MEGEKERNYDLKKKVERRAESYSDFTKYKEIKNRIPLKTPYTALIQGQKITCNGEFALFLQSIGLERAPPNGRTTMFLAPKYPKPP